MDSNVDRIYFNRIKKLIALIPYGQGALISYFHVLFFFSEW